MEINAPHVPPLVGDDPDDIRRHVAIGGGRSAFMPPAWRRCATGVTNERPPTLRQPAAPSRSAPALTRLEADLLAELRAAIGASGARGGFMPRKAIRLALFGYDERRAERDATLDAALASLARRGLIAIDRNKGGGKRTWVNLLPPRPG